MKEFSLFVPHQAPIDPQPVEEKNEKPVILIKKKANLYSEAASVLLKNRHDSHYNNHTDAASLVFKEFDLDRCRSCGSVKLNKFNNVYVCKTCGSENTINGVLFGDKLKKKEK